MKRLWHCQICDAKTQYAAVVGGAIQTADGRILSAQFRGTCAKHAAEIGQGLVRSLVDRGAVETTRPTSVKTLGIPAWRREAEFELQARDSHQSRGRDLR